ncbi:C2 calcium-dependent membrane targeting [Artemisia annua]|uniref:C2 calcium-dependent membrane targeting n=1 Tax=Artemisia annua TaxID=35608 RepID=A0A2U1N9M8_ARTAN|nr:C2 calcium-dependent membrane targeting [Artemisia annua]
MYMLKKDQDLKKVEEEELFQIKAMKLFQACQCRSPIKILTNGLMVPGSRNPMWGDEFNFSVDELPVKVLIKCFGNLEFLGSVTIPVDGEGQTGALWHPLSSSPGQPDLATRFWWLWGGAYRVLEGCFRAQCGVKQTIGCRKA